MLPDEPDSAVYRLYSRCGRLVVLGYPSHNFPGDRNNAGWHWRHVAEPRPGRSGDWLAFTAKWVQSNEPRWYWCPRFTVPDAMLAAVFAALPTVWVLTRRRHPPHACRRCGYDLRATPARCPECGAVPKSARREEYGTGEVRPSTPHWGGRFSGHRRRLGPTRR